jgi:hypothetical protein
MKYPLIHHYFAKYTAAEWLCLKLSLVIVWLDMVRHIFIASGHIGYPTGICRWIECDYILLLGLEKWLYITALLLSILYLLEWQMKWICTLIFITSLTAFTLEESSGILNRSGLFTMVFLAQSIAYWRNKIDLTQERFQFPIQIIAGGYILAGLSKLYDSGLGWIGAAPQVAVQIIKNYSYSYFDTGDPVFLEQGYTLANQILKHTFLAKVLFGCSLFLELNAWLAVTSKRNALVYGVLLVTMHLGILLLMHLLIGSIFYPMLIVLINPLYLGYKLLISGFNWVSDKIFAIRYS